MYGKPHTPPRRVDHFVLLLRGNTDSDGPREQPVESEVFGVKDSIVLNALP